MDSNIKIVPWFSWEEWNDVYRSTFGNCLDDWKSAYEQMSVWKSRVSKLPIGIEGTLPLLHAEIALLDSATDESSKNSLLNMAILKFVSIAVKGIERRHHNARKSMQDTASILNFPQYLVDIRNSIVHGDSVSGTSLTLKSALESGLKWIKINYWDVEASRMSSHSDRTSHCEESSSINNNFNSFSHVADNTSMIEYSFDDLREAARDVAYQLSSSFLDVELDVDVNSLPMDFQKYVEEIHLAFCKDPEQCVNILVEEIFYSQHFEDLRNRDTVSSCCGNSLPAALVKNISFILALIKKLRVINVFTNSLIKKSEDHSELCIAWVQILCNTAYRMEDNSRCYSHSFKLGHANDTAFYYERIKWRAMIYNLFCLGKPWASDLGIEVCNTRKLKQIFKSRKLLKRLSNLYNLEKVQSQRKRNKSKDVKSILSAEIKGVETVLSDAKKVSGAAFEYLQDLSSLVENQTRKGKKKKNNGMVLGRLPYQEQNSNFYLQLILSPEV